MKYLNFAKAKKNIHKYGLLNCILGQAHKSVTQWIWIIPKNLEIFHPFQITFGVNDTVFAVASPFPAWLCDLLCILLRQLFV